MFGIARRITGINENLISHLKKGGTENYWKKKEELCKHTHFKSCLHNSNFFSSSSVIHIHLICKELELYHFKDFEETCLKIILALEQYCSLFFQTREAVAHKLEHKQSSKLPLQCNIACRPMGVYHYSSPNT